MKASLRVLSAAAVAATVAFGAGVAPAGAADIKLKFATFGSANSPIQKCAYRSVLEDIEKASGGKIEFETYFGGQFGRAGRQYDQLVRGIMDMAADILTYKPGAFPLSDLMTLPMMFSDPVKASRALMKVYPALLKDELKDVHVMWLAMTSPYVFHLREPINSLADLKGQRVRVSGRVLIDSLSLLGINGVALPVTEQYENLQKGVIAGSLGTWTTVAAFKLQEVTKFHYELDFAGSVVFFAMSKRSYAALPADMRKVIDSVSTGDMAARASECFQKADATGIALAKKAGSKIVRASAETRAAVEKQLEPVIEKYLKEASEKNPKARAVYKALKEAMGTN
ncbi:MAG: TRAP transporter substrate-binding protein [Rhodospirillaceae bacterium]|nr:TRAP transporter substrate-binding protein [Rhodospirillaceae bacterium]